MCVHECDQELVHVCVVLVDVMGMCGIEGVVMLILTSMSN